LTVGLPGSRILRTVLAGLLSWTSLLSSLGVLLAALPRLIYLGLTVRRRILLGILPGL
jgi:hypothetical protein